MRSKYLILIFVASIMTVSCGVRYAASIPMVNHTVPLYREHPRLTQNQIDSLYNIFSPSVIFCDEFIEPSLIALSYYPDLVGVNIEFRYSKEATTMAARPKPRTLFVKKRRRYLIVINNDEEFEGVQLKHIPFNAQIGIIGHELAHIADYEKHNMFGVIGILFRYADKGRKPLFEKEIDRATIERGLGWQLYDWAEYSIDNPYAIAEYEEFKRTHYMQPHEIEALIKFYSKYSTSNEEYP